MCVCVFGTVVVIFPDDEVVASRPVAAHACFIFVAWQHRPQQEVQCSSRVCFDRTLVIQRLELHLIDTSKS